MTSVYLSYDCAHKSLAVAQVAIRDYAAVVNEAIRVLVEFVGRTEEWPVVSRVIRCDATIVPDIIRLMSADSIRALEMLKSVSAVLRTTIQPMVYKCVDLIPGRKLKTVGPVDRVRLLKAALDEMPTVYDHVLIEDQPMSLNFKSSSVQDQLLMYYADSPSVHVVNPRRKNQHCFESGLEYSVIAAKYAKKYDANKSHTRENFRLFAGVFGWGLDHIAKANLDDVADAFMQAIAFHYSIYPPKRVD